MIALDRTAMVTSLGALSVLGEPPRLVRSFAFVVIMNVIESIIATTRVDRHGDGVTKCALEGRH